MACSLRAARADLLLGVLPVIPDSDDAPAAIVADLAARLVPGVPITTSHLNAGLTPGPVAADNARMAGTVPPRGAAGEPQSRSLAVQHARVQLAAGVPR
jgi:hypothetical protein